MKRIQKYFRKQTLVPLALALGALSVLALLTQSLSTIDLIVENRQSAFTFLYITLLALPQLLGIILPLAVFIASLYALNRLNLDSELVVAKAAGYSPWQLASPVIRVACYALIVHLIINLFLQPYCQRQMRTELLKVRTDLASQLVKPGEFNRPAPGLTVYAGEIMQSGQMLDVLIYDSRNVQTPTTYTAKSGVVGSTVRGSATLSMRDGNVQYIDDEGVVQVVGFDDYQFDLSEVMAMDTKLWFKTSDQYIHELFLDDPSNYARRQFREDYLAEGHARLSTPLYNIALVMIALCFLVRGEFQRMGYGKRIAAAAAIGFVVRLCGFALSSAAQSDSSLNWVQYGLPLAVILICGWYMQNRKQSAGIFRRVREEAAA